MIILTLFVFYNFIGLHHPLSNPQPGLLLSLVILAVRRFLERTRGGRHQNWLAFQPILDGAGLRPGVFSSWYPPILAKIEPQELVRHGYYGASKSKI